MLSEINVNMLGRPQLDNALKQRWKGNMKLLLVEDNTLLVEELEKQLKQAGYVTDVTDKATEADYLIKETNYDCVILDIGLPDGNGLELLETWRNQGINTPVIMLTARSQWHEKVEGFNAGADDYLGKPFHTQELLVRIHALIHRAHGKANTPSKELSFEGVTLDENQQSVQVNDTIFELTAMEFRLLKIFLMSPKSCYPKHNWPTSFINSTTRKKVTSLKFMWLIYVRN